MRSYYESFGAVACDSNGESEQQETDDYDDDDDDDDARRRTPDNAGTGGISSDSKDYVEQPWWRGNSRGSTPLRQPAWDGWSEDGTYMGSPAPWVGEDRRGWSWYGEGSEKDFDRRSTENWSWKTGGFEDSAREEAEDQQSNENWSWKTACSNNGSYGSEAARAWKGKHEAQWDQAAFYAEDYQHHEHYDTIDRKEDEFRDRKGEVKVAGEEDSTSRGEKKPSRVSSTYPPVFRAKPQESYLEWKRSVEFWIGGEGGQLPPELVGPRMMVQLKDRAAQLVKRLSNKDVNGADGMTVIFAELEKSPLIRQMDKHMIDEHRRRLMHLNRAPNESIESYITRASLYRSQLLGLDSSLAMGEAFYVGHLMDHAHLSHRDRAMVKTKAGSETDEYLVTNALVELATELEGEAGYPIGMSEPNMARNGEEWLLQRGDGRARYTGGGGNNGGRVASGTPGSRAARHSFAAEYMEAGAPVDEEPGDEDFEDGETPPELLTRENEAFGMQYKAKQKIAEVRKLRQFYKKPDNEAKRKALAEQMRVNPCHNCGELGGRPQQVLVARTRNPQRAPEVSEDREWDLLLSLCSGPTSQSDPKRCPSPQYKGQPSHQVFGVIEVEGFDVLWSLQDLAFKIILDIGCMRSVAGVQWANLLVERWQREGRWFHVEREKETFKFGGGEVLTSRFRLSFVGKLHVKNYGVGQESGHYTLRVDDCEVDCASLPMDFRMEQGVDAVPIISAALKEPQCPTIDVESEGDESFKMVGPTEIETRPRRTAPPRPEAMTTVKGRRTPGSSSNQASPAAAAEMVDGVSGLTPQELQMLTKRRTKQAASKAKAIERKALTGIQADFPSLSHAWSYEARVKAAVEAEGGGMALRPLRIDAPADERARHLGPDVGAGGPRRPNRGVQQKIKGWMAGPRIDLDGGWDLASPRDHKRLLDMIRRCQPDLVTCEPPCGPWCGQRDQDLNDNAVWERRQGHLPFWRLAAEIWALQANEWRTVVIVQPVLSQALQLSFMRERDGVHRAVLPMCGFGLCDPENHQPYDKKVAFETNNGELARNMMRGVYCTHGARGHQTTQGYCKEAGLWIRRSEAASRWPPQFCERMLEAAEHCMSRAPEPGPWSLRTPTMSGGWETMAVASHDVPDEGLRQELAKHSMTGERKDFVRFEGAANQQPRRLRALVAHLHVTMGHLSNDRRARMLRLSGANDAAVNLASSLRCQVCAMTRPPLPTPQVAYQKPKAFNERVSGDSFYVWDAQNQKFAVTHYIDALTDYQVGDLTDAPDSSFSREVFQDLWLAVFGPPDLLITDGGSEFRGSLETMLDLFGVVHEVTPEGAKWRLGQAELMVMKLVKGMGLTGLKDMRHALLASVGARNRTLNRGGVSPMQAVTGRNTMIPGSLMQQLSSGNVRFKYNAASTKEALARAERIRIGAVEAFHWLDSHDALRRALASRSRPPHMEGIREGAMVYGSSGPEVIVCAERDKPIPQRIWVRIRGRVKAFPLEKLRLATVDEMVEEVAPEENSKGRASSSSSSSSTDTEMEDKEDDPVATAEQVERAKLLDDLPHSVARNLEDKRKRDAASSSTDDPHTLDFQKKQKLFEELAKQLQPHSSLEEAFIRKHLEDTYARFKQVKKAILTKPKQKAGRSRGDGGHTNKADRSKARSVMQVSCEDVPAFFRPGEMEALVNDTVRQWSIWGEQSAYADHEVLVQVSQKVQSAEMEGITEVTTGRARVEYKWSTLDPQWRDAFKEPLKKAVGVYLEHKGICGVPADQIVDPTRVIGSRFVLTNKGEDDLSQADLKARWVFGGHRDPDAGLYATASPTASVLGHNLLNFVAVQLGWVVHYEDVSAAFLQGKVTEFLMGGLGNGMRPDMVQLTKGGFGLPESPRLWYLADKETLQELGLHELALVPGLFRAFHFSGENKGLLRALASIHVDDTRYAGDHTSQEIWDRLHLKLKFGKMRKATEGWQKFCGRWERQDPETFEMEYSMSEYTKSIPMVRTRAECPEAPSTSTTTPESSSTTSAECGMAPSTSTTTPESSSLTSAEYHEAPSTSTTTPTCPSVKCSSGDAMVIDCLAEAVHQVVGPDEALTDAEKKLVGSVVGQLNWAARQGRYDLSFVASSVQQLAGRGHPSALKVLNQGVKRAKEDVIIKVRNLGCGLEDIILIAVSDAAYGAMPGGHSQGGIMVMLGSPDTLSGMAPVCPVEGISSKIQRVVRCSMSAEVSSLATCFEHGDFVRAVFCELIDHKFKLPQWKLSVARWPLYLVTDARRGYDCLNSDTLPSDRKIAIDVAVLRQAIIEDQMQCFVRWVPGSVIPCDGLTKWADNHVLLQILKSGEWALVDSQEAQELRRKASVKRSMWRKAAKATFADAQRFSAPEGA
ncbi:RE2 [Symbiodinium sp. CCMP2592]|nr:RE2 [Symbiodinium sp. CCMP2592]